MVSLIKVSMYKILEMGMGSIIFMMGGYIKENGLMDYNRGEEYFILSMIR